MIIRYSEKSLWWRWITLGFMARYKADVYNASDDDITRLREWLKFQGINYSSDRRAYFSADNENDAERYKPKITIHLHTEDKLAALKLTWS